MIQVLTGRHSNTARLIREGGHASRKPRCRRKSDIRRNGPQMVGLLERRIRHCCSDGNLLSTVAHFLAQSMCWTDAVPYWTASSLNLLGLFLVVVAARNGRDYGTPKTSPTREMRSLG